MRQEHYQKAEERNVTNGKAEEFTPSVCIVERKTRPPSQDHSTLKQSLDGKAGGGSVCVVTLLPEKYDYMGTEGWAFPVPSCKHTTGTPVLGCMRGSHSTHACNALASQCRFPNSRSPQAVTTRVMSWD